MTPPALAHARELPPSASYTYRDRGAVDLQPALRLGFLSFSSCSVSKKIFEGFYDRPTSVEKTLIPSE